MPFSLGVGVWKKAIGLDLYDWFGRTLNFAISYDRGTVSGTMVGGSVSLHGDGRYFSGTGGTIPSGYYLTVCPVLCAV